SAPAGARARRRGRASKERAHVRDGFRWCPHCAAPHALAERICPATRRVIEGAIHVAIPRHPLVGTVLQGKYRILDRLGAGGMGEVFEAENLQLGRLVALKIVTQSGGPQARLRLEREAQIVASVHHPNTCAVYDVGVLSTGGPFVVFERL